MQDGDACLPARVTDKYLVTDAVYEIEVARQPVDGHVFNICGREREQDIRFNENGFCIRPLD